MGASHTKAISCPTVGHLDRVIFSGSGIITLRGQFSLQQEFQSLQP